MVFDLDGTLVDSARDLAEAASELVQSYGGAPLHVAQVVEMVGEGASMLVRRALEQSSLDPATPGSLARFLEIYDRRLLDHTVAYPGIRESLSRAVARGPLAVLTNKPLAPTVRILDALSLRGFFTEIIGGDGPYPRKPDPAGLHALMTGTSGHPAILVGDSPADSKTAEAGDCAFAFARYGFGAGKFGDEPPVTPYVLDHARELSQVLDRFAIDQYPLSVRLAGE
jgi:phosphoglycolate phosphatase